MCKQCKKTCSVGRRKREKYRRMASKDKKSRDQMRRKRQFYVDWLFKVSICNQICFNGIVRLVWRAFR
jgi:hypothetical protein